VAGVLVSHSRSGGVTREPQGRFRIDRLEERVAPSIVPVNPGGNTPQGNGANNGRAIEAQSPAGHAPPGHNK
jgi:hypothetical protein